MYKFVLAAMIFAFGAAPVLAAPEKQTVCVEQKDPKTGKPKQVCKEVKVHKKLEGTKVPPK